MRTTIRDVAKKVNLSHTTVSRVLNKRDDITIPAATRQRVLAAAGEMGYRANPAARALVTGRSHVVAFWTTGMYRPYFSEVILQVQRQIRQHRYEMIISDLEGHIDWQGVGDGPSPWPVDGIFALGSNKTVNAYLDAAPAARRPLVSMGAYYVERTDFVGLNLYAPARDAVQHLLDIGCRRVAYVVPGGANRVGDARRDGYATVLQEAGREPEYVIVPDTAPHSPRAAARHVLSEYVRAQGFPDGVFCYSDEMAIGAFRALRDAGARIPDDVALVGCDGTEDTEYLEAPLSTIVLPLEEMCTLAWQFLERRMNDASAPLQRALLEPQLVVRASSRR